MQPPEEGWHDTGDIVHIDGEGFVTIAGRAKRFAKIAGEMVSLAVAERIASAAYPDWRHAVVALPDARRGERLVLVSEAPEIRREALIEAAQRERLPELAIPRDIVAGGDAAAARLGQDRLPGGDAARGDGGGERRRQRGPTRRRGLKCGRNGAEKRPEPFVRSCEMR